jgi:hypothetical protein
MALQIDEQGPIRVSFAPGPIIHAEHARRWHRWFALAPQNPQQRVRTDGHAEAARQRSARPSAVGEAEGGEQGPGVACPPGIRRNGGASRSVKMRRRHSALSQKKRRTRNRIFTGTPLQGTAEIPRQ